jgi:fluoride ion exporter CrcB/FEX
MLQHGNTMGFIGYVATSVIVGLALIALGYWSVKVF